MSREPTISLEKLNSVKVVNIRVKHIHPLRLPEWMVIPGNIYIGRGRILTIEGARFPPDHSPYHNPFRLISCHDNRELVVSRYRAYLDSHPEIIASLVAEILAISAPIIRLGCWCAPEYCHGHILLEYIGQYHLVK